MILDLSIIVANCKTAYYKNESHRYKNQYVLQQLYTSSRFIVRVLEDSHLPKRYTLLSLGNARDNAARRKPISEKERQTSFSVSKRLPIRIFVQQYSHGQHRKSDQINGDRCLPDAANRLTSRIDVCVKITTALFYY